MAVTDVRQGGTASVKRGYCVLEPTRANSGGSAGRDRVFSVVFVPTLACNCQCTHCFEQLDNRCFSDERWELVFRRMAELGQIVGCGTLRLYWQGGEVLCLGPDAIARALEVAARVFRHSEITLEHHLQTNLLLYDSTKWKDVVGRFAVGTISSSLDYPNAYRKTAQVSLEAYNDVWIARKREAEADGFKVSVVSLPNPGTLRLGAREFYRYFAEDVGIANLQINFPFPGLKDGLQPLDLADLTEFMTDLYTVWVESGRTLNLSPYQALEDRLFRDGGTLACCWSYTCADSLVAVGPDLEVAQCDCWLATFKDRNYGVLSVEPLAALLGCEERRMFADRPLKLMRSTECGECAFWKLCYGGCAVRAYAFTGDLFTPDHYCQVYKAMFSAVSAYVEQGSDKGGKRANG